MNMFQEAWTSIDKTRHFSEFRDLGFKSFIF